MPCNYLVAKKSISPTLGTVSTGLSREAELVCYMYRYHRGDLLGELDDVFMAAKKQQHSPPMMGWRPQDSRVVPGASEPGKPTV